jgi:hypothetical protein
VNLNRPPLFCQFSVSFRLVAANEEDDTCFLSPRDLRVVFHRGGLRGRKGLRRTGKRGKLGPDLNLIPPFLSLGRKGAGGERRCPARWRRSEGRFVLAGCLLGVHVVRCEQNGTNKTHKVSLVFPPPLSPSLYVAVA